jgi:hypothetical protein
MPVSVMPVYDEGRVVRGHGRAVIPPPMMRCWQVPPAALPRSPSSLGHPSKISSLSGHLAGFFARVVRQMCVINFRDMAVRDSTAIL